MEGRHLLVGPAGRTVGHRKEKNWVLGTIWAILLKKKVGGK